MGWFAATHSQGQTYRETERESATPQHDTMRLGSKQGGRNNIRNKQKQRGLFSSSLLFLLQNFPEENLLFTVFV